MKVLIPVLLGLLSGCSAGAVIVDDAPTSRASQVFVGQPFQVRHIGAHPRAGAPSIGVSGEGGEIVGNVCGVSMNLSVSNNHDQVEISGFIDGQYQMEVSIKEVNGYRRIVGNMAYHTVDLSLFGDRLMGWIGHCRIDMREHPQTRDSFVEHLRIQGFTHSLFLDGIDALWALPAADQAAILPLLLQCQIAQTFNHLGLTSPRVGFGGKESALPPGTMSFASKNTYCR